MCGLTGSINWQCDTTLQNMLDLQRHRGPDDSGTWFTTNNNNQRVGLGSVRLSIRDLSTAGHMPMISEDGTLALVFNGEIYNDSELRNKLEKIGYRFKSNSDTETVLVMYQHFGPNFVKQLNGMFSLALWDEEQQHLFMARDHFGIKPFYYINEDNRFAFSSEIKSFTALPDFKKAINTEALQQYLTFLWVPDPLTMFSGVHKLEAGHSAILKNGKFKITKYWDLTFPSAGQYEFQSEKELALQVRNRFSKVVKSQMVSDVPIGAFLSAGLDSSSILACMRQHTSEPIKTYTITFPEKYRKGETTIDDPAVAARTAEYFNCSHKEILVDPDVTQLLPKLVWHMDEPISDPALLVAYLVSKEASSDVSVLLSGVGGDEIFGGYRKYRAHQIAKHYQKLPVTLRRRIIEPLISRLPSMRGTPFKGYVRLAKKMARSGSQSQEDRFITDSVYMSKSLLTTLLTDEKIELFKLFQPDVKHRERFKNVKHTDFLNQMLYLDSKIFMPSLNLTYNDKMSMASSVEVRVPFLDWEFAEWAAKTIPPEQKIKGKATKHILRKAIQPWLPNEVLSQRKAGFYAPIDYWLANDLKQMVDANLSEKQIEKRGIFKPDAIKNLINDHRRGKTDWSMQIWQLLTLELWLQAYID